MNKMENIYANYSEKTVYFSETDAGGVVYFGNIGKYIEIGFSEWFREFAKPLKYFNKKYNIFFVVKGSTQSFKKSLYYDDRIVIKTTLKKINYYSITFSTNICVNDTPHFLAETTLVPVNINTKSVVKNPEEIVKFISEVQK
jgi:YbgC/YbaW family acyl-CoA thioester hydrolase